MGIDDWRVERDGRRGPVVAPRGEGVRGRWMAG